LETGSIGLIFVGSFPEGDVHNSRIKNIGHGFIDLGWQCDFISLYPSSFSKGSSHPTQKAWRGQRIIHMGSWVQYPRWFMGRIVQLIYCQFSFCLFILTKSKQYDVLYFYTPQWVTSLTGLLLAKLLRRRIMVDYTDLHSLRPLGWWHKTEELCMVELADRLLVISDFLRNHFKDLRPNIVKIPLMINFEEFNQNHDPQPFHIGYIGSFGDKDGLSFIYKALSKAILIEPRLKLVLMGYDPNQFQTQAEIERRKLANNIDFKGRIDHDKIASTLMQCDTFVMHRNKSLFADSGFPAKLGDYLACKRPILMADDLSFSGEFTHQINVFKYENNNPQSLADAILYRYENQRQMEDIASRGYDYAKSNFDAKIVSKQVVQIAADLLSYQ